MIRIVIVMAACSVAVALLGVISRTVAEPPPALRTATFTIEDDNRCEFATVGADANPFTCDEYRDDLVPFLAPDESDGDEVISTDQRATADMLKALRRRTAKESGQ